MKTRLHNDFLTRLANLKGGDHLVGLHETAQEYWAMVVPFLRSGFERNEKVLYLTEAHLRETMVNRLREEGLEVEHFLARGQLLLLNSEDTCLSQPYCSPNEMISWLKEENSQALTEGYAALRVTAESTRMLRRFAGYHRLIEYEASLQQFLAKNRCLALCLYNQHLIEPAVLLEQLKIHPLVMVKEEIYQNIYFIPGNEFPDRDTARLELRQALFNLAEHKKAEVELQETERMLGALLNHSPGSAFFMDTKGTILAANELLAKWWCVPLRDLIGSCAYHLLPPEVAETRTKYIEEVIKTGKPVHFEDAHKGQYMENYFYPVFGPEGQVEKLAVFCLDVTEQKLAEKARKESEGRFRAIFEGAGFGIALVDLKEQTVESNPELQEMFGCAGEELRRIVFFEFTHPDHAVTYWDDVQKLLAGQSGRYQMEKRYHRKNGQSAWFQLNVTLLRGVDNEPRFVICIVKDITDQKQAEKSLQLSEERFRALFENTMDMVVVVDSNGTNRMQSPSVEKILGYRPEERLGQNAFEFVHPQDRSKVYKAFTEGIPTPESTNTVEHRIRHRDGSWRFLESRGRNLLHDPALSGILINARDITDRKRTEQELKSLSEKLRTLAEHLQLVLEEERTRIAREIHDELGQMLTGLKMDLSWVKTQLTEAGSRRTPKLLIDRINSMSDLTSTTIESVRRIATELRPGVLDDVGLTAAIEWQTLDFMKRTGIQCRFTSDFDHLELDRALSTAMFRILQEALTNVARHAMATRVNVRLSWEGSDLLLKIDDNGRGISAKEISDSRSLGLLGMSERALLLGGEVNITGRSGKGTKMRVRVPIGLHRPA